MKLDNEKTKKMDSMKIFELINNYINQEFSNISNYKDSIKYFEKLNLFFNSYNYVPNPDFVIELIDKNSILNKMIELIFNQYNKQIISGNLEKIFDNNFLILAVETYCMLENIEIKESDSYEEIYDFSNEGETNITETYLREIHEKPLLSDQQVKELIEKMSHGDNNARNLFIESNLKLVVSIAKKYQGRGLPLLDLIQDGNLGLMKAVDRYDISRKTKFSTYATYWIKRVITMSIANNGRNIRVPVSILEKIIKYNKTILLLESRLNAQPTIDEIANEMGLPVEEVRILSKIQHDTVSINVPVGDEEDSELGDFIPSSDEAIEDIAIANSLKYQVRKLLEECNLDEIEKDVLILRNGFNGGEPLSLEKVGKKYNLTRERVRQIEAKALTKIRESEHIKDFAVYMQHPSQSLENLKRELHNTYLKKNKCKIKN